MLARTTITFKMRDGDSYLGRVDVVFYEFQTHAQIPHVPDVMRQGRVLVSKKNRESL